MEHLISIREERQRVVEALSKFINDKTAFICIGTNRVINDSIGPMVGTLLSSNGFNVYGTMGEPVNGLNIKETYDLICLLHGAENVIAIDASTGSDKYIGQSFLKFDGVKPGSALNKDIDKVGALSIVGATCKSALVSAYNIDSSYELIGKMSDEIASVIVEARELNKCNRKCDTNGGEDDEAKDKKIIYPGL